MIGRKHSSEGVSRGQEANKALTRRLYDEMNAGNVDALGELLADDYLDHNSLSPAPLGKAAAIAVTRALHAAVPGLHRTVEQQVADNDRVVDVVTYRGVSASAVRGIPAGTSLEFKAALVYRIKNGRIQEARTFIDRLAMFEQAGVAPPGYARLGQ